MEQENKPKSQKNESVLDIIFKKDIAVYAAFLIILILCIIIIGKAIGLGSPTF